MVPECILIADDVTGACDTGVQFARRGHPTEVWLDPTRALNEPVQVLALNTDSRCDAEAVAKNKIRQIADLYSQIPPGNLFKKIDSILRGNVGQEIEATMRCFGRDCAIIAPAFPAMGRTVKDGILEWKDGSGVGSIDIQESLERQGIPSEQIILASVSGDEAPRVEDILRTSNANRGIFVVVDCAEQADLSCLVSGAYHLRQRILWVGAAGLGIALALQLGDATPRPPEICSKDASVLFWIGSSHAVTQHQTDVLLKDSAAIEICAEPGSLAIARRAIQEKRNVVLKVERTPAARRAIDAFLHGLTDLSLAGMLFTGGDTAMLICDCLGVRAIRLMDEIVSGMPWGSLHGGAFDGLTVATKAGGFGDCDALLHCAEFFSSCRKVMA